jgi:RNA polymerase sigma-70 factor (ECF subfamily)
MPEPSTDGSDPSLPLALVFLDASGWGDSLTDQERAGMDRALSGMVQGASGDFPEIHLEPVTFVRHVGKCAASRPQTLRSVVESLKNERVPETIRTTDLYLACACANNVSGAIERFEQQFRVELAATANRFAGPGRTADDLRQVLREKLFVGRRDRPARIADYLGTGSLKGWLRVTAVRALLDERRTVKRKEREALVSPEQLMETAAEEDWELGYLKAHYREAFKKAFGTAVSSLTSQQRNILRFNVVEGLSVDQIGAVYRMHRSSVSRRLVSTRKTLLEATREELGRLLKVDGGEFESIMNLIQSRLDVSLTRILAPSRVRGGTD